MKITAEWNSYLEMYEYCRNIVGGDSAVKAAPASGKTETGKIKALTESKSDEKPSENGKEKVEKPAGEKTPLDLIKEAGVRLSEKRMDGVRKLLTKFKVAKFSELKPEEQPKFLEMIEKMEKADDTKYAAMLTSLSK